MCFKLFHLNLYCFLLPRGGGENGGKRTFTLHPWLKSEEAELNFLRKVSEALLLVVLPKYYAKSPPIRHLLREVVANRGMVNICVFFCDLSFKACQTWFFHLTSSNKPF